MIRNYIIVAVRNITRHKLYAFINVAGLSVGLASCVLVILFVQREFAFNGYHERGDRIYHTVRLTYEEPTSSNGGTSGALGPALKDEFPGIEATTRVWFESVWALANDIPIRKACYDDLVTLGVSTNTSLDGFDECKTWKPAIFRCTNEKAP